MYTSYFANLKNIDTPYVSISGKSPDWYTGPEFKVLAPKWSFFKDWKDGLIDNDGYIDQYYDLVLNKLNVHSIYEHLTETYGENCTLLCYEKPGDFCHRHLVAEWFNKLLNINVKEYQQCSIFTQMMN